MVVYVAVSVLMSVAEERGKGKEGLKETDEMRRAMAR